MEFEEFVNLLDDYGIDYYYDDNKVDVLIDDINLVSNEFKEYQNEVIDLMTRYPEFGTFNYYSEY